MLLAVSKNVICEFNEILIKMGYFQNNGQKIK